MATPALRPWVWAESTNINTGVNYITSKINQSMGSICPAQSVRSKTHSLKGDAVPFFHPEPLEDWGPQTSGPACQVEGDPNISQVPPSSTVGLRTQCSRPYTLPVLSGVIGGQSQEGESRLSWMAPRMACSGSVSLL